MTTRTRKGKVPARSEVVEFLLGNGPLDGVWFGDPHPSMPGKFWWRWYLRAVIPENKAKPRSRK
jgi:hypothetical protein